MDYKKIIKSQNIRFAILKLLSFVPDRLMLKIQYKIKTGRALNLKNPTRYTEKLQWYKINYKNPVMHQCVDKYNVREFVKSKGLEHILVDLYARYDSIQDVDWEELPNSFVIKTTNGGGGLNVVICHDKSQLDIKNIEKKLACKKIAPSSGGREWAYYGLNPGIVVEELLVNQENPQAGINDYKIFCYSGKAKYIIVDVDRYIGHKRNFYDTEWHNLNVSSDCPSANFNIEKPANLDEMLEIAEKLSEDFPFLRVYLYNVQGRICFGEMTFYPWSGYVNFEPDELDFEFAKDFELKKFKVDN